MSDEAVQAAVAAVKAARATESTAEPAAVEPVVEAPSPAAEATEPPAKVTEPAPPATPPVRDSKAISEWAELELRNRREQQRLERERGELATVRAEAEKAAGLLRLAREDPRAFLQESGLDIDELTKGVLEGRKADPHAGKIEKLEAELAAIRAEKQKETASQEQARIDRAMAVERDDLAKWIEPQAGEYPHLMAVADGKAEVVADAIQQIRLQHYNSTKKKTGTGEVLDEKTVARQLEETWKARFQRAAPKLPGTVQPSDAAQTPQPGAPATISRKHASRTQAKSNGKPEVSGRDRALARLRAAKPIDD